jgi:hypothetical protein
MPTRGLTFNKIPFLYEGSIDSSLRIFPLSKENHKTGIVVYIDKDTIDFVKRIVSEKETIAMGACRDNPSPHSIGEMLLKTGKSPQFLSYILPLLEEKGFLTHFKEGRAYYVKKHGTNKTLPNISIKKEGGSHEKLIVFPSEKEFLEGCRAFEKHEKRDSMYKVATFLIKHFWESPREMTDALGVLLFTWNHAFYRYGLFDYDKLENCIKDNIQKLADFRKRNILSFKKDDEEYIKELFDSFHKALQISEGKSKGKSSSVAVSKALHLLAPAFLPLWDYEIAQAYHCYYNQNPAEEYIKFCKIAKKFAEIVQDYTTTTNKTLLKQIDEYNYSKYTQEWI